MIVTWCYLSLVWFGLFVCEEETRGCWVKSISLSPREKLPAYVALVKIAKVAEVSRGK